MDPGTGVILGTVLAGGYFAVSESTIPKESNCSYLAPASTDAAAWVAGAVLIALGVRYKDGIITGLGSAIATLHVAQYASHKTTKRLRG